MKFKLLLLLACLSFVGQWAHALELQFAGDYNEQDSTSNGDSVDPDFNGFPLAFGVNMGTTGFGLHFSMPISSQFGWRASWDYMPFSTSIKGTYSNRATNTDVKAKANSLSLLLGYTPFVKSTGFFKSFGINIGAAYFLKLKGDMVTRLRDPYKFGDIDVSPDLVGLINTDVKWKESFAPYAGLALNNIVIDSKFSAFVDLGCYYLSKPTVQMSGTGLLEENSANAATVQENIKNYRYLPRVTAGFAYRWKN